MSRRVAGVVTLVLALGCGGLGEVGDAEFAPKVVGAVEVPTESHFGHWALPEELAGRARAAGWEVERCERYDDGRWVTTACDLRRDGAYAFVSIDELPSADEAREQAANAEPSEAVTRDGNLVMFARVFDRRAAAEIRDTVGPEGETLRLLDQATVQTRVEQQGWSLTWCDETESADGRELDCELSRDGAIGFLELEFATGGGGFRGEDRLLEGPAAVVDQGDAVLAVEIPDTSGAGTLLVSLLGATPVEEVAANEPVPVPDPTPAPEAAPAPEPAVPAPAPAPEPAVPEPAPAPEPAVAVAPPEPAPVQSGVPGAVSGGASVTLVLGSDRHALPAVVPPGRYTIEATFPSGEPFEAGKVTVMEGQRPTVACRESLGICRAR